MPSSIHEIHDFEQKWHWVTAESASWSYGTWILLVSIILLKFDLCTKLLHILKEFKKCEGLYKKPNHQSNCYKFHCTVDILIFIFMTKSENKDKQTDHALNFFSSVLLFFKQRGKLLGRCLFYVIFSLFEQCLCSINKFCKFSVSKRAWLLLGDNWKNWNGLKLQLYGQQLQKNSLCSVFLIYFYGWKNGNT